MLPQGVQMDFMEIWSLDLEILAFLLDIYIPISLLVYIAESDFLRASDYCMYSALTTVCTVL
jgi:hypothetical protein